MSIFSLRSSEWWVRLSCSTGIAECFGWSYNYDASTSPILLFSITTGTSMICCCSLTLFIWAFPLKLASFKKNALMNSKILVWQLNNKIDNILISQHTLYHNNLQLLGQCFLNRTIYFNFGRTVPNIKIRKSRFSSCL